MAEENMVLKFSLHHDPGTDSTAECFVCVGTRQDRTVVSLLEEAQKDFPDLKESDVRTGSNKQDLTDSHRGVMQGIVFERPMAEIRGLGYIQIPRVYFYDW